MSYFYPPHELPPVDDVIANARIALIAGTALRNRQCYMSSSDVECVVDTLHDALYAAYHKLTLMKLIADREDR